MTTKIITSDQEQAYNDSITPRLAPFVKSIHIPVKDEPKNALTYTDFYTAQMPVSVSGTTFSDEVQNMVPATVEVSQTFETLQRVAHIKDDQNDSGNNPLMSRAMDENLSQLVWDAERKIYAGIIEGASAVVGATGGVDVFGNIHKDISTALSSFPARVVDRHPEGAVVEVTKGIWDQMTTNYSATLGYEYNYIQKSFMEKQVDGSNPRIKALVCNNALHGDNTPATSYQRILAYYEDPGLIKKVIAIGAGEEYKIIPKEFSTNIALSWKGCGLTVDPKGVFCVTGLTSTTAGANE